MPTLPPEAGEWASFYFSGLSAFAPLEIFSISGCSSISQRLWETRQTTGLASQHFSKALNSLMFESCILFLFMSIMRLPKVIKRLFDYHYEV